MDNETQKDEIIALESIYNEEEFSYREVDGKYECTLKIFIRLPDSYHVNYKDTRAREQQMTKVSISHLPPLTLYVSLPPDYPTKSPPKFTLCSSWLRHSMLTKLCQKLDELWRDNEHQEILFTWIAFLQNETLECLGIQESVDMSYAYTLYSVNSEAASNLQTKEISGTIAEENARLEKNAQSQPGRKLAKPKSYRKRNEKKLMDERAIVDRAISKNPVQLLVDYNEERNLVEFKRNFYMCKICFCEKSGQHSTQFTPCRHVFCKECITEYLVTRITDGSVQNIGCPEEKCTAEATPGQIKELVSPELFAKYDSVLLSVTLETMTDIVYCPRRHCQYPVSREPDEQMANCPACQYAFCVHCKMVYHGVEPCKVTTGEKQKLVRQYQEASPEEVLKMEKRYGKKQLKSLVENAMSEDWITSNSHHCPHCNAAIEKSDGCNKMVCGRCGTYFCWICGAQLNPQLPYLHYQNPESKCYNMLHHGIIQDEEDEDDDDMVFPPGYIVWEDDDLDDFFIDLPLVYR